MDEHAQALESSSIDDLASFLSDNPAQEPDDDDQSDNSNESTDDDVNPDDEENEQTDDEDEESDDPEAKESNPDRKVKITTKAEDGTETVEEIPESELVKGYQRHSDYTQKTQALSHRENEAVKFLQSKHQEIQSDYLQKAELTRTAIVQMAGIRSESEMAEMAQSDPAGWVAENQRQRQINAYLNSLDQKIQSEKQQAQEAQNQQNATMKQEQFNATWQKLNDAKIDRPTLESIYGNVVKNYGFSQDELNNVYDHRLVLMMKDAAAYKELQSKKAEVTKKVDNAPRLPNKQNTLQTSRDKALDQKFKSGRAKLSDLASYLT